MVNYVCNLHYCTYHIIILLLLCPDISTITYVMLQNVKFFVMHTALVHENVLKYIHTVNSHSPRDLFSEFMVD